MNNKIGNYKTVQNLSSETLFHLTGKLDILKLILQNGFQARYIYEKLPGRKIAYLTKTVCFCDIPLGAIKEHINWYGEYGIGINRPKARENGCTPVFYMHSKTPDFPAGSSQKTIEWFDSFKFTKCLKQVRGQQIFLDNSTGRTYFKWKTFYNEKEWRYFPAASKTEIIKYEVETDLDMKKDEKNIIPTSTLPYFKIMPEWIEYILIKDSKDLPEIKKILKKPPYDKDYENLLTKIITIKQVLKDF